MKNRQYHATRFCLFVALFSAQAHAQLTWDANGTGTGQTNGTGAWLGTSLWWNGSANLDWVSGSNATFGGASTAGGAVSLTSPLTAGSINFSTFTGSYTVQGTNHTLTQSSGITVAATAGNVTFRGTGGTPNFLTLAGAGGVTMNGTGLLVFRENIALSYTGATVINSGVVMLGGNVKSSGNFTLNGAILTDYFQATTTFTSGLGAGNNQIQIYGDSGFGAGNGGSNWRIGAAGSILVWGASGDGTASGFFNPSSLKFLSPLGDNLGPINYGQAALDNGLDLNGAARTVQVLGAAGTSALNSSLGRINGVISGSTGSLIKTGAGNLVLTAANTYGGGTTINQGSVRFTSVSAMPPAGIVTVNTGATLVIEAGGASDWTNGTTGVGTLGGLFSGLGGAGDSTVNFSGDATLRLEMTGNLSYAGDIPNLGTNLALTKTGGNSLTLGGNNSYSGRIWVHTGTLSFNSIANVGAGSSALGAPATAANGTINIGSDGATVTLAYTGSGHSSNRVIHLPAASGTTVVEASGTGPIALSSSLTAVAGAKTLTLTGTNTGANTFGTTAMPTYAEVLTVNKTGAGTWVIPGFSSPKNVWTVSAGTLRVTGGISTGDQNFTVSGGTLAGVGPITLQATRTLAVNAAGSIAPGNSGLGTLAVTGILNVSAMVGGTGKFIYDMSSPATSDRIAVTGTAQIGTGLLGLNDFVFTDLGGMTANTYTLISTTGGITGTLDPDNRIGTIGTISGALQISGNNLEFTIDSDLDGMPDSYELANTTPPSPTALDPNGDALLDNDGLTTLQEYLIGTNPNNPDTDADGLLDGVETRTGTWVSATNTGTNPLVLDTDGDTIRDGYETKTNLFVSATNTGTDPNKRDSDGDALADPLETGTGIMVSRVNTGTDPNKADTDADGAGDWYEVSIIDKNPALGALPNSPNLASLKPNIPYPLPDPDASTGVTNKPVKVYIMSGQSNMVGIGNVAGGAGSLDTIAKTEGKFPHLVNGSNAYTTRNDVRYRGVVTAIGNALLTPGQGSGTGTIGPELGFGHVMGYHHDEPVLLLKSSEGNRTLNWDILPPGSPSYPHTDGKTYAGYGQSPNSWVTGTGGPSPFIWYAGKQHNDFFYAESDFGCGQWAAGIAYVTSGNLGSQVLRNGLVYRCIINHTSSPDTEPGIGSLWSTVWNPYTITNVVDVLDGFGAQYPTWAEQGFEIAGFVWWQGFSDQGQPSATRYESGLVRLISSLRSYYENRYPGKGAQNAPFVVGTIGFGGWTLAGDGLQIANAQLAVSNPTTYPAFAGNVKTIETRSFWRELSESPGTQGFHYNNNAETYMLAGDALGRAMIDLQSVTPPSSAYATWANGPFASTLTNSSPSLDFDNAGLATGIEWVVGGDPTLGSDDASKVPVMDTTTDPNGKTLFIFRRATVAKNDANTNIVVEYGGNLTGWTPAVHQGSAANQITITETPNGFATGIDRVTVALPANLASGGKIFARLKVGVATP